MELTMHSIIWATQTQGKVHVSLFCGLTYNVYMYIIRDGYRKGQYLVMRKAKKTHEVQYRI